MGWKRLDSRVVFENDWMEVREDHVINPGGGENQYGYVHFKNRAVAIIPLDDEQNTWLVGQQRYTLGEWSWELPMGGAPLTELPLEALAEGLTHGETDFEESEDLEIRKIQLEDALTMVRDGSITDAISVAALLRIAEIKTTSSQ